jgi:hypothetical protein
MGRPTYPRPITQILFSPEETLSNISIKERQKYNNRGVIS